MADAEYKRLNCGRCFQDFTAERVKKYCSPRCREGTTMSRDEYRASRRDGAAGCFVCEGCGKDAYRPLGGRNIRNGYQNHFCSRQCRADAVAKARAIAQEARRQVVKRQRMQRPAPRPHYVLGIHHLPPVRTCPACGCQWSAIKRLGPGQYCPSSQCQEAKAKLNRKAKAGNTHIARARKHGRRYGYFNVLRVFERDAWTCQICGIKTPKRLRGTMDDRAPELDHILAIAVGGDHVIENCQCACRRCNADKGASGRGQMWLDGFADTK